MSRYRVNPKKDKKKFSKTARSKKAINVSPVCFRGGIRL